MDFPGLYLDPSSTEDDDLPFNSTKLIQEPVKPTLQFTPIVPHPGFCVKFVTTEGDKVFVNVCHHDAIPPPKEVSEAELVAMMNTDVVNLMMPVSISEPHYESDHSLNPCAVYDIATNSSFFREKLTDSEVFKEFFLSVVLSSLDQKFNIKCDPNVKCKIMTKMKQKGQLLVHRIENRDRRKLPGELIEELDEGKMNSGASARSKPIIQEISNSSVSTEKPSSSQKQVKRDSICPTKSPICLIKEIEDTSISTKNNKDRNSKSLNGKLDGQSLSNIKENKNNLAHECLNERPNPVKKPLIEEIGDAPALSKNDNNKARENHSNIPPHNGAGDIVKKNASTLLQEMSSESTTREDILKVYFSPVQPATLDIVLKVDETKIEDIKISIEKRNVSVEAKRTGRNWKIVLPVEVDSSRSETRFSPETRLVSVRLPLTNYNHLADFLSSMDSGQDTRRLFSSLELIESPQVSLYELRVSIKAQSKKDLAVSFGDPADITIRFKQLDPFWKIAIPDKIDTCSSHSFYLPSQSQLIARLLVLR